MLADVADAVRCMLHLDEDLQIFFIFFSFEFVPVSQFFYLLGMFLRFCVCVSYTGIAYCCVFDYDSMLWVTYH